MNQPFHWQFLFKKSSSNEIDDTYNQEQVECLLQFPDGNQFELFAECDLEYPTETKQTSQHVPFAPINQKLVVLCFQIL